MKFAAIIASRGRPEWAMGTALACKMMASGKHPVRIIIACDDDDPANTAGFFARAKIEGVRVDCRPRPPGVTACWNRAIAKSDADVMLALPDDGLICCPDWDAHIADYMGSIDTRLGCMAIHDTANPGQATILLAHRDWIRLAGFFDERYPFWFSDTAINETYSFVTGRGLPILGPPGITTKAGNFNPRMRDMTDWWAFYGASRRERLAVAQMIRAELGLPTPDLALLVSQWEHHNRLGLPASEEIVASLENPKPPDAAYLQAKAHIDEYMLDPIGSARAYVDSGKWRVL